MLFKCLCGFLLLSNIMKLNSIKKLLLLQQSSCFKDSLFVWPTKRAKGSNGIKIKMKHTKCCVCLFANTKFCCGHQCCVALVLYYCHCIGFRIACSLLVNRKRACNNNKNNQFNGIIARGELQVTKKSGSLKSNVCLCAHCCCGFFLFPGVQPPPIALCSSCFNHFF